MTPVPPAVPGPPARPIEPPLAKPKGALRSESLFRKRVRKFRRLKRGYYSFVLILAAYIFSFFLPFVMTSTPLAVKYQGHYYFTMLRYHRAAVFVNTDLVWPDFHGLNMPSVVTRVGH